MRQSRYAPAKGKVVVCEWEDAKVEIGYRGERLIHEEIATRPAAPPCATAKSRPQREGWLSRHRPTTHGENGINKCGPRGGQRHEKEPWKWHNCGKRGNPKTGCPLFPQLLGNLTKTARFPHSHGSGY